MNNPVIGYCKDCKWCGLRRFKVMNGLDDEIKPEVQAKGEELIDAFYGSEFGVHTSKVLDRLNPVMSDIFVTSTAMVLRWLCENYDITPKERCDVGDK